MTNQERAVLQAMDRMRNIHIHRLFPELSPAEGHLLSVVVDRPQGITVSALSEALDMPMSAVSRMMRSMEARELIERRILPQDRRSIIVTITPKGLTTCAQLHESFHGFFQEILGILEPVEFEVMISGWNRIMDRMEEVLSGQDAYKHDESVTCEPVREIEIMQALKADEPQETMDLQGIADLSETTEPIETTEDKA